MHILWKVGLGFLVVAVIVFSIVLVNSSIDSFEECVAAGYPVGEELDEMGGWWQECRTPDGKIFMVDCNKSPGRCV